MCIKCDVMNNMVDKMHNMMYNEIGTAGKRQEKKFLRKCPKNHRYLPLYKVRRTEEEE